MSTRHKITPFLWFDKEAGDAVRFYTSIFEKSRIVDSNTLYDTPSGTVEIYTIELLGQEFSLMSAGPEFKFNEAISFVVTCETQEEIDYYWAKLSEAPGSPGQCGWLRDKFGLSWQVTPKIVSDLFTGDDAAAVRRTFEAVLHMTKLDIAALQRAFQA